MGPSSKKRSYQDKDERRPKKKIRVKKQKTYHSSSEEESSDDDRANKVFVASDAPAGERRIKVQRKDQQSSTKSILKQKPNASIARLTEAEINKEEDGDSSAEDEKLARNTAINAGAALESEDSQIEDALDMSGDEVGIDGQSELDDGVGDDEEVKSGDEDEDEDEEDADDLDDDSINSDAETETSITSSQATRLKKKRNDPSAFATSISKILDTKLSTSKRNDPVLSRSKSAAEANQTLSNEKLEAKARAQIRAEKKNALERGRVKDVLGLETDGVDTGAIVEQEKRLKKTAQRGVVKLFNAVRAAQVTGEQAMQEARKQGMVGMRQREEKVNEMSKQGFLDLISSGGKSATAVR